MRYLYLALAIIGLILPYSEVIPFLMTHGLDPGLIIDQMFANRIASAFAWDLVISAVVVIGFVVYVSRRVKISYGWRFRARSSSESRLDCRCFSI